MRAVSSYATAVVVTAAILASEPRASGECRLK
jgi:hypothetical protein